MKKNIPLILALGLLLSGCLPEERFWWSPDGRQAAVIADKALYLVTQGAGLGVPLTGGTTDQSVTPGAVSWLRDGSGFVLGRNRNIATWAEAARLVPPAEAARIKLLALALPGMLENAASLTGSFASAGDLITTVLPDGPDDALIALRCAYQMDKPSVGKLLQKFPDGADLLQKLEGEESQFSIYELCVVKLTGGNAEVTHILARSFYAMAEPRVSPKRNAVAWLQANSQGIMSLYVCSLDGREYLTVCDSAKATFDWTPDGRSIVFAVPAGTKDDSLAKIQRVVAVLESGALMPRNDMPYTALGMAFLLDPPRLQVLPDGRVLFASQSATLPAAGTGPAIEPRLYVASEDGKKIEALPTAAGALPTDLSYFTASPDGKLAAVVESGNDAVAVVNLETGAVEVISPAHADWSCRTMPAWKSATELTFAALGKSGDAPQWMLWSKAGGVQPIGENWPAAATADWLEKAEPKKNFPPSNGGN